MRVVSRSFRVPPEVDRMLDEEARKRDWSKSFLIRDILVSWASYNKAKARIE
jgi:predicted transcriptional regulator